MVDWTLVIQVLGAFIGVYFTAIMVDAPRKYLPLSALIGGIGWFIYLLLNPQHGPLVANYFAGLFVAFSAHIVARLGKTPVTVSLIPGFYPLVPGVGMYKTVLFLIQGDLESFKHNFQLTLLIAAMIALSIFTADTIVAILTKLKRQFQKKFTE